MKKDLFGKWYSEEGRDIAIKYFPLSDYDFEDEEGYEKELRKTGKKIFNSIYKLMFSDMKNKLINLKDGISETMKILDSDFNRTSEIKNNLMCEQKNIKSITTDLYDSYFNKEINKEVFNKMKKYYGEKLDSIGLNLNNCDKILHEIKKAKREVQGLCL